MKSQFSVCNTFVTFNELKLSNFRESASEFCNKNNDVFITPDGNAKVCRMKQDEIQLLDDKK